jgi:exopolysaccharide biosynthesis polyprenyl glycosylphosphotransferase
MFSRSNRYGAFLFIADLVSTEAALYLADLARHHLPFGSYINPGVVYLDLGLYLAVLVIWAFFLRLFAVYDPRHAGQPVEELRGITVTVGVALLVFSSLLYVVKQPEFSRLLLVYLFFADTFLLMATRTIVRVAANRFGTAGLSRKKVLIVGAGRVGGELADRLQRWHWMGMELVGYCDDDPQKLGTVYHGATVLGVIDDVATIIENKGITDIFMSLPSSAHGRVVELALGLQREPVRIKIVPDFFQIVMAKATVESLDGIPLIGIREPLIAGFDLAVKRAFDLVVTLVGLIVFSPAILVIVAAIKLDSRGPVLFKQQRVGENGRLFWMYKFRSMVDGADKQAPPLFAKAGAEETILRSKLPNDPLVTRVGRVLRRTSLDELPQLVNVLKGEMSVVGPRPELPHIVADYDLWQRKRLCVPPGMTGWWQVNGRSNLPLDVKTEYDLYYIQNYSFSLDLRILWMTFWSVLKGTGAY